MAQFPFSTLTDDEAIRRAWDEGDQQARDLARRLESLKAQISQLATEYEQSKPGEPDVNTNPYYPSLEPRD